MGIRQWKLPDNKPDLVHKLAAEAGLADIVCQVLAARGIEDGEEATRFVGEEPMLGDPFLLVDMDKAVERIQQAIDDGERIAVYGDYDCDGVTSTTLLTSYLQAVGADVIYYVPSREKEGYGLNRAGIDLLLGQKTDLIITVDNGISAHDEIAYATTLGIDVVVTDHHTPRETLPPAIAVVNPHRKDCGSTFKELAGVGVAFKLICALEGEQGETLLEHYADLAALGTIADVMPLTGENRSIVRHGLRLIQETDRPGIAALLQVAGLEGRELTSEAMAFGIIPRINAAGRMGSVDDVIELLLTDDVGYATEAAELVNEQNVLRKKIENDMLAEIESMIAAQMQILNGRVLILSGKGWHHGVVGIVAAKLVERYDRPCILLSIHDGEARGSGRTVAGYNLIKAITACSEGLTRFGGHMLAAGLTLPADGIEAFSAALQEYTKTNYPVMPLPQLTADCTLTGAGMTIENISALSVLEPFGSANESPLFHLAGLTIQGIYPTADGKHIRVRFAWENTSFYAIYFNMSSANFPYQAGETVEIMAKISAGEYNGKPQLSVKLSDVRPVGVPQEEMLRSRARYVSHLLAEEQSPEVLATMVPSREDIGQVYKFLRRVGAYPYGADALYLQLFSGGADYCKVLLSLDVLEEMGFIAREGQNSSAALTVIPDAPRADLAQSAILQKFQQEMLVK